MKVFHITALSIFILQLWPNLLCMQQPNTGNLHDKNGLLKKYTHSPAPNQEACFQMIAKLSREEEEEEYYEPPWTSKVFVQDIELLRIPTKTMHTASSMQDKTNGTKNLY